MSNNNPYNKLLILSLIFLINLVSAQRTPTYSCITNAGNYTRNSTYSENLSTLLSSLPSKVDINGFYNASTGLSPDEVNAVVLCRLDVELDRCRSCVRNATVELVRVCPNQKQAVLLYEFCILRYSNNNGDWAFGTMVDRPMFWIWNPFNVTGPRKEVMDDLRTLVEDISREAANGGSLRKIAVGNKTTVDFQTIYAMVQCTPDLSPGDCTNCLMISALDLPKCCYGSRGGSTNRPSCRLRYDLWPFYNETRLLQASLPPPPPSGKINGDGAVSKTVITVVGSIAVLLVAAVCGIIFLRTKILKNRHKNNLEASSIESLQYDYGTIRVATNNFSDANKLGQGGFGAVYLGKLPNGKEIAVKRLSRSSEQGDLEFNNEVLLVVKLQHRNLVRLLGFSTKEDERLLVYEFVQNGSLDRIIFDPIRRLHLDWNRRYKIIKDIAKGLVYLHEDSLLRIIHRDLKASNILLDEQRTAKIADFGMARLFERDETHGSTSRIVGTHGYMAPEYAYHGQLSVKSDVFSFGVLVLEITSGQKNSSFRDEDNNVQHLPSFAWRKWQEGTAEDVIDPILRGSLGNDILRCIHIGLLCVQENAADRPTISHTLVMFNSSSVSLPIPSQPAYFMPSTLDADDVSASRSNVSSASRNEVSTTSQYYPR